MAIDPENKSPYHGYGFFIGALMLVPVVLTLVVYAVLNNAQGRFGAAFNWASARTFGCGVGLLFHLSCAIVGAFGEHFHVVKARLAELFSDLSISRRMAWEWYLADIKEHGVAFWIDLAVLLTNAGVFLYSLLEFLRLYALKG